MPLLFISLSQSYAKHLGHRMGLSTLGRSILFCCWQYNSGAARLHVQPNLLPCSSFCPLIKMAGCHLPNLVCGCTWEGPRHQQEPYSPLAEPAVFIQISILSLHILSHSTEQNLGGHYTPPYSFTFFFLLVIV